MSKLFFFCSGHFKKIILGAFFIYYRSITELLVNSGLSILRCLMTVVILPSSAFIFKVELTCFDFSEMMHRSTWHVHFTIYNNYYQIFIHKFHIPAAFYVIFVV